MLMNLKFGLLTIIGVGIAYAGNNVTFPTDDPFYSAAEKLNRTDRGSVLKLRKVPNKLAGLDYKEAYQIQFHSTNTFNDSIAAVTTVVIPNRAKLDRLVSYQVPEDSAWIGCAESYVSQQKNQDEALQAILDQRFVLSFPDYEGPNSAFGAGQLEGRIVLDSIRAVLKSSSDTGVKKDAKVALWGYSGGSIASGWANELANDYAPEIDIKVVVAGGYVANLTATALQINDGIFSGFAAGAIVGLFNEYPLLAPLKQESVTNKSELLDAGKQCMMMDLVQFAFKDTFAYFKNGERILSEPPANKILESLEMGKNKLKAPMFVYHGVHDQIAPVKEVDRAVDGYCKLGSSVQYYKDDKYDHPTLNKNGMLYALDWVVDGLNGKSVKSGCQTHTTQFDARTTASSSTLTSSSKSRATTTSSSTTTSKSSGTTITYSLPSALFPILLVFSLI